MAKSIGPNYVVVIWVALRYSTTVDRLAIQIINGI